MQKDKYSYKAATANGAVVTGEFEAVSSKVVASQLQQQGMTPLRIQLVGSSPGQVKKPTFGKGDAASSPKPSPSSKSRGFQQVLGRSFAFNRRSAGTRDLVIFSQDLAALLKAGVPLPRSLMIIAELIEKKKFEAVVHDLHDQVKEGSTFWQALEKHPAVFSSVFVNMVKAGEAGGVLDTVLDRLGSYLDGVQELKEYLFSAMIYPLFLSITAAGSITVLLAVVVPKFAGMFADMGIALPWSTAAMLYAGTFLQSYWWLLLLLVLAIYFLLRFYISTTSGRYTTDRLKLRIPILGGLLKKIEISRFCRTFGTLLDSGVPILSALQMVRGVLSNVLLGKTIEEVHLQLKQGEMLSSALRETDFFPPMAVQMISIGEETGRMDHMLMHISDIYDRETKVSIKAFTSLFEPLIILLMGLVIGAMVISMLLAIFSVNDIGF